MEINKNSSREDVLAAVKLNGSVLEHASDKLKADREVVLTAVKSSDYALRFASDELKADPELIKISSND